MQQEEKKLRSCRERRGKVFLRDTGEVSVFREKASDEAVGVFIAAAFRGAVRMGRVMNGSRVTGYA